MNTLSNFLSLFNSPNTILFIRYIGEGVAVARLVITGGTGHLGRALMGHEAFLQRFEKITVLSRDLYQHSDIEYTFPEVKFKQCDLQNTKQLSNLINEGDLVIHAAGDSSVVSVENNPSSLIQGSLRDGISIFKVARQKKARRILFVSSIKACKPTSAYGAGKMMLEKLFSSTSSRDDEVSFASVRLASLLGSSKNVLTIWKKLVASGSPIQLSHRDMTRYFMRTEDACNLIIDALLETSAGDIYVPKLSSFRLIDLANQINKKEKIIITGLNSGEKIHDDLISLEEALFTKVSESIYTINSQVRTNKYSQLNHDGLIEVKNSVTSASMSGEGNFGKNLKLNQASKFLISTKEIIKYLNDPI
jgi:UDP-N-acetylglucosamine 4,6-dehydratase